MSRGAASPGVDEKRVMIRIANAAGFWGDDLDAPRRTVESARVDYLTLEYLAELTMSILAHQRAKDPRAGFATDVLSAVRDMVPALRDQPKLRVMTNAGGVNPPACAAAVGRLLVEGGLSDELLGVVTGDDLLPRLTELQAAGCDFANLDTGQPLDRSQLQVASANAYLGAAPLVEALSAGARIVVTGRVADASLTVAPAMHEFGWSWQDWHSLAAATVAGHLIECGAQVTGGYSARWQQLEFVGIGYPIAEIAPDGTSWITKPEGSGGVVDRQSVVEQLVYEIGDPAAYLTPDVVADFTSVEVVQDGEQRVRVAGAAGRPAPEAYKVSLAYAAGYQASAQLLVWGSDAVTKARFVGELILRRLERAGVVLARTNIECLGAGAGIPGRMTNWPAAAALTREVVLRVTAHDPRRWAIERFAREIAPLITNGPAGLAGYATGRPSVRPVLAYWPTLVPRTLVAPSVQVRTAREWSETGGSP